ncbi:unnamed protein product, partial [Effrenium voratum]
MAEELQQTAINLVSVPAPMDEALNRLRFDPRVQMHLLPLAKHIKVAKEDYARSSAAASPSNSGKGSPSSKHVAARSKKQKKPSAKAKSICPHELQGFNQRDSDGNAICWSFNMKGGCQLEVTNGRCKKGVHKCGDLQGHSKKIKRVPGLKGTDKQRVEAANLVYFYTAVIVRWAVERGRKYKPLVSEYGSYQTAVHFMDEDFQADAPSWNFPAGAKAVSRRAVKWGDVRADVSVKTSLRIQNQLQQMHEEDRVEVQHVGIPRDPLDFAAQAVQTGHPRSFAVHLPQEVVSVLEENISGADFTLAKKR